MDNTLEQITSEEIQDFIRKNQDKDVAELGLKKPPKSDWPYASILDQIKARQKAKKKLPSWLDQPIIFPAPDLIEQASSEATAHYKASLFEGKTFVDLTAGAGVDSCAFSKNFQDSYLIEPNTEAINRLIRNKSYLFNKKVEFLAIDAKTALQNIPLADLIYIDPQRRDNQKKGYIKLENYSPNIIELLPDLKIKTNRVLIKASPMLDIEQAVQSLKYVDQIHAVEWQGECKEILFGLNFESPMQHENIPIHAVEIDQNGAIKNQLTFTKEDETETEDNISQPQTYLYEPGPAFLKAGAFKTIAHEYGIKKLHQHTHLYTSQKNIEDFPGRSFEIIHIMPVQRKNLDLKKANLAVRNFPEDVQTLRKKLKLKDGGQDYLFACTDSKNNKALIHCKKIA